jgi:hypothetical protein
MNPAPRRTIEISITVRCDLTNGWGGERWDVLSVTDDRTGDSIGDIGIDDFNAYSDFPGPIASAVRDAYFQGMVTDANALYCPNVSIRGGGSEIGSSTTYYWGKHPCEP